MKLSNKTKGELYQTIGAIILFPSTIFFADALINLQLLDDILIQMLQPKTLLTTILGKNIDPMALLIELTFSILGMIIAIITIIEGITITHKN